MTPNKMMKFIKVIIFISVFAFVLYGMWLKQQEDLECLEKYSGISINEVGAECYLFFRD